MRRIQNRRNIRAFKNESVEDPRELLLSLVDLGSLDAEEVLLACVQEMSDAECKRVLNSLTLPSCCDEVEYEDEEPAEDDDLMSLDDSEVESEDEELDEDEESDEEQDVRELESKIRKLERLAFGKRRTRI